MSSGTTAISIVTATRNGLPGLRRAIESVRNQTGSIEHIVVDGASDDGTAGMLASLTHHLGWWCSEPDEGIAHAFNKGLARARGDIIGILNSDDWYEPHTLRIVQRAFAQTGAEVLHAQVRYWNNEKPLRIADGNHSALRRSGSVNHPSVFVHRKIYERLGHFDTSYRYAMDYELMLRWLVSGVRFRYLPVVLANMSLGGVSDTRRPDALREVRRAQRLHLGRPVADAQHLWLMARYRMRQTLDTLGLQRLVAWQRSHNRGMRSVGAPQ